MSNFVVGDRVIAVSDGLEYIQGDPRQMGSPRYYDYARGDIGTVTGLRDSRGIDIDFDYGAHKDGCSGGKFELYTVSPARREHSACDTQKWGVRGSCQ